MLITLEYITWTRFHDDWCVISLPFDNISKHHVEKYLLEIYERIHVLKDSTRIRIHTWCVYL